MTDELDTETKTCPLCGKTHTEFFKTCGDCLDARSETAKEESRKEAHRDRQKKWVEICPAEYRRTRWNHPGLSPIARQLAASWWPDWHGAEPGLGLYGSSGIGKTRCAWSILQRLHFAGVTVAAVDAVHFARAAADWHCPENRHEARRLIGRCKRIRVLLFDDLGKERATNTTAAALHDLFEERCREGRPLIWTSERTGDELAQHMGDNYADGIIRRLRERTQIHHITPPTLL